MYCFLICLSLGCISRDDPRIVNFNKIKTLRENDGFDVTYLFECSKKIVESEHWNYLDASDPCRLEISTKDTMKEGDEKSSNNMDSAGPKSTLQSYSFKNSGSHQEIFIYPFVNVCNSSKIGHAMDKFQTLLENNTRDLKQRVKKHDVSLHQLHQLRLKLFHYKYVLLFYNQQVSFI